MRSMIVMALAVVTSAGPALAYSVEHVGDWQISTFGDGVMSYVGPNKERSPSRVTSVNLSKRMPIHGEERYLPAFAMVDLGVARPTYLTHYFSVTGFRQRTVLRRRNGRDTVCSGPTERRASMGA